MTVRWQWYEILSRRVNGEESPLDTPLRPAAGDLVEYLIAAEGSTHRIMARAVPCPRCGTFECPRVELEQIEVDDGR